MSQRERKPHSETISEVASPPLEATVSFTGADAPQPRSLPNDQPLARYRLEREVARGGLGRVLSAYDARLRRPVAVKELLRAAGDLETRFNREVEITARLQHPGIVPVYDAGSWESGAPFYVMKLLSDGQTLKQRVEEARDLSERLALIGNVIAVADAIAYAHNLGIIHRDIKPSNVIVGPFGETVVIDWGLAKDLAAPPASEPSADPYRAAGEQATVVGAVLGTPQYMAPEQARGEAADRRTDVYALGALLYFVLARKAPHGGDSAADVVERVRTQEPLPVTAHVEGIAPDLSAIVAKAMSRDPAQRYEDAAKLVEDLRRFHNGQLVRAHNYSAATLLRRWARRHRALLTASAAFVLVLAVLGAIGVARIARERAAAIAKRNELVLLQARSSLEHDPTRAIAWLKTYPEDGPDTDQAAAIASTAANAGIAHQVIDTGMLVDAAFLPDGRSFVGANFTDRVGLWDTATGRRIAELPFEGSINDIDVSPDGTVAACVGYSGQVVLWDLRSQTSRVLGHVSSALSRVVFSADGKRLAVGGVGVIAVWELGDGSKHEFHDHKNGAAGLAFTRDGSALVSHDRGGRFLITSIVDGHVRELAGSGIGSQSLSDDGLLVAGASESGVVSVWSLSDEKAAPRLLGNVGGPAAVVVRFVPHSHSLISATADGTVWQWNADGTLLRRAATIAGKLQQLEIAPDGRAFVVGLDNGHLMLWDTLTGEAQALLGHTATIRTTRFASDGTLLSGGTDDQTRIWTMAARQPQPQEILQFKDRVSHVIFSPDGSHVAAETIRKVHLCETATSECRTLNGHRDVVFGLAFSPDGRSLASAGWEGVAYLWDVATGNGRPLETAGALVRSVEFTPDGKQLVVASNDGLIRVWNRDGDASRQLRGEKSEWAAVVLSPSGDRLVAGGDDGSVRLWNLADGSSRLLGHHATDVEAAAFAPDGRHVATSGRDGSVRVWDLKTSSAQLLAGHHDRVTSLAFSADGTRLAASSWDHTASVWNLRTGERSVLRGHDGRVRAIALSPNGTMAATASDDRTVRLWDLRTQRIEVLSGYEAPVRSVAFSPKANLLAASSDDGTARLWEIPEELAVPWRPRALWEWMSNATTLQQ